MMSWIRSATLLSALVLAAGCGGTAPTTADEADQTAPASAHGGTPSPEASAAIPAEAEAKPIDIATVSAEDIRALRDNAEGKVVVLNLWATWCPPCVAEMPYFNRLHNETERDDLVVISISADAPETIEEAVRPFATETEMPFDIAVMDDVEIAEITEALDFPFNGGLPVTLIYKQDGSLAQSFETDVTYDELRQAVDPLLES